MFADPSCCISSARAISTHRCLLYFADEFKVDGDRRLDRFGTLDERDLQILEALQANARAPLSELGREIGLSQPAVSERVKRLEDAGIIEGYGARVNPRAVGLRMMAIIRLRTTHEHIKACLKKFADIPNIIEVHRVTGEDCFILKVLVPLPEDLATIVDRIAGFGAVTTSVVLRSETPRPVGRSLIGRLAE